MPGREALYSRVVNRRARHSNVAKVYESRRRAAAAQRPSWRRARKHWERAILLGDSQARKDLLELNEEDIPEVTASPINKT